MAFLIVKEEGETRHIPIDGNTVSIGRAADNDAVLYDQKASRHHAVLELDETCYYLRDLNSLNGCYVDGLRVREQAFEYGSGFVIGNAELALEKEEATALGTNSLLSSQPAIPETSERFKESAETGRFEKPSKQALSFLSVFQNLSLKPGSQGVLKALADLVSRFLLQARVCVVKQEQDKWIPLAFSNFLSPSAVDELPKNLASHAKKAFQLGEIYKVQPPEQPEQIYLAFTLENKVKLLLFIEHVSKQGRFSEQDYEFLKKGHKGFLGLLELQGFIVENELQQTKLLSLEEKCRELEEELQEYSDLETAAISRLTSPEKEYLQKSELKQNYPEILGHSKALQKMLATLEKVTNLSIPVLIIGESGSGKELVARALHFNSTRADKGKFIAENCAALPENLLESELFGHQKGAFTGADKQKVGRFELAKGGTLFLDEIGEMSPLLQAKLLRVLEKNEIRPVGSNETKKVDFRLITATNRSLEEMVQAGTFRQDLYYRINAITLRVPALRERKDDIPLLMNHYLKLAAQEAGFENVKANSGVLKILSEYKWPGNVRELRNEVKRMVALSGGEKITLEHLSPALRGEMSFSEQDKELIHAKAEGSLKELVEEIEKIKIVETLSKTKGNKSQSAEILGLSRVGLRKKMERYGIS